LQTTRFSRLALGATAALAAALLYAGHGTASAKPMKHMKSMMAGAVSSAPALLTKYHCNACHAPNLMGKPGFSPSIKGTGSLHDYTQAQFVKLMHTGMQNDGKHVRRPMPVFAQMPTTQAVTIFKYLKAQK
jgi:mono/diheme cytochrome c family protein